jgi:hypothetical protein
MAASSVELDLKSPKLAHKPAITHLYRLEVLKVHAVTIKTCNCPTCFDTTYVSSSGTLLKA